MKFILRYTLGSKVTPSLPEYRTLLRKFLFLSMIVCQVLSYSLLAQPNNTVHAQSGSNCVFEPGTNSKYRNIFEEAYRRNGGKATLGLACNMAHWWNGLVVQDFYGGSYGKAFIVHDENKQAPQAYALWGKILLKYWNNSNWGPPTRDVRQIKSLSNDNGEWAKFGDLDVYYNPKVRNIYGVRGIIGDKLEQLRVEKDFLGLPESSEINAAKSGASDISGKYQYFEGGIIHAFEKNGVLQAYEIHGAIQATYNVPPKYLNDGQGSGGHLGFPISDEQSINIKSEIAANQRFQKFEGGAIYYNGTEGTSVILYNKLNQLYESRHDELGFPISSQIEENNTCLGYFELGYIDCKQNFHRLYRESPGDRPPVPAFKLPYPNYVKGYFTGGPHVYCCTDIGASKKAGYGSGIDFQVRPKTENQPVIAMASGTVVQIVNQNCSTDSELGCRVAIRHEFGGSVMIYGHLQSGSVGYYDELRRRKGDLQVGMWIKQGFQIGIQGNTGVAGLPIHIHVELRDGTAVCDIPGSKAEGYPTCYNQKRFGGPISWDERTISGYTVSSFKYFIGKESDELSGNVLNYQGSIVLNTKPYSVTWLLYGNKKIQTKITSSYIESIDCDQHRINCVDNLKSMKYDTGFADLDFYFQPDELTSADGSNVKESVLAELRSDNVLLPYSEKYKPNIPPPDSDTPIEISPVDQSPPNPNICDQSQPGVVLYTERSYKGTCAHFFEGKYNLTDYKIDNAVSSIWISGDYTVKMWEGAAQGGRNDEFSKSDDNIDDKSLGEQWSSIEIVSKGKEGSCPKDGRGGVYFYKDKDFKGACVYSTGDIKDFGNTSIGNNSTSSARIIGNWEVTVFDSQNLKGKTYKFTSSKSNLDDKPDVGKDISSARVKLIDKPDQPIPACDAPILLQPTSGSALGTRTISFSWGGVVCERSDGSDLYRLRIKTAPSMESGGETVLDQTQTGGSATFTLDARWERQPLYWSVQVGNAKNGAAWANANLLTLDTNLPPSVAIQNANDQAVSDNEQLIWDNQPALHLNGSTSDADGNVVRVEVACSGQSCEDSQPANLSGDTWNYQRNGLSGHNQIEVNAVDNLGKKSGDGNVSSLSYWVDQAPPQTGIVINNSANPANWPQWFTDPVVVQLAASDVGSGSGANLARAGVKELHYRLNGGEWQTQLGNQLYLEINSSGVHSLGYYAVDNVGNAEAMHTQAIALDLLPPSLPTALAEMNGVVNDQWQKSHERPIFTWQPANDAHSHVWGYQFYFGDDPTGEGYHTVQVGEPLTWTPQEKGVTTGSYYLRGRTRDQAGNWSDWATLFTFRFDKTPPANPEVAVHANNVRSEQWQRVTSSGLFTWTTPSDEGSGVQGYFVYWGSDPQGKSTNFINSGSYQSATPLCAAGETCTGYLRLQAQDQVGNLAPNWNTVFVLRYDSTPPTFDFTINGGAAESNSVFVTLFLNANDAGSGPAQMQFAPDGVTWSPWITYTATQPWTISGISGEVTAAYARVRDGVGNESPVVNRSIRFEANIPQPQSTHYTLFNSTFAAGGGEQQSPNYWMHSTVAEPPDSAPMVSPRYLLVEGYEAGGVAAQPPAPTPTPLPPPSDCNEPPIVINNGSAFTGQRQVLLRLCASQAISMQVSDNAGFSGAQWESFALTKSVTLAAPAAPVFPLYAYVRFRNADGSEQGPYADFIYFDATQPAQPELYIGDPVNGLVVPQGVTGAAVNGASRPTTWIGPNDLVDGSHAINASQTLLAANGEATNSSAAIDIYVNTQDDLAGSNAIQLSEHADFADATWQTIPANNRLDWAIASTDGDKALYARVQDKAGNISTAAVATFTVDLSAPTGGIALDPYIVGAATGEVKIYLTGYDSLSGVSEMRLNTDPLLLQGDLWRPYTTSLTIPAYLPLAGELSIYVQYRDPVGNVSEIYSDTYKVDVEPPNIQIDVDAGETLTRKLRIYGYDGLSEIKTLRLSNDLDSLATATPMIYSSEVLWQFDERRVVWVQAEDSLGNRTEAIPVYADGGTVPANRQIYLPLINR